MGPRCGLISYMSGESQTHRRFRIVGICALAAAVAALAWPAPSPELAEAPAGARRFVWGRDSLWSTLETSFATSRAAGCSIAGTALASIDSIDATLARLRSERVPATAPSLDALEDAFFRLAPRAAACGALADDYIALQGRLREAIKWQSTTWDLTARDVRDRLYRLLYGSRAAVEEVMLQHQDSVRTLSVGSAVPSATPSAISNGVVLHSGDVLCGQGSPVYRCSRHGSPY